jgi:hypothetical protein
MTMKGLGLRLLQTAHQAALRPAQRRFAHALSHCEAVQLSRLRTLVTANAESAYGHAHRFGTIASVRDWQDRVPIVDYETLQPWVQRAAAGEAGVLTTAPVLAFERSSGSTAANKLVPYTAALLGEFSAATAPWLSDLYTSFPALRGSTSYWSISPATRQAERTSGGIPIGLEDDTDYFGPFERFALRRMMAVPAGVARIPDMDAWADATARHLVAAGNLGLISIWHPSFFALLFDRIDTHLDDLLGELPAHRAAAIRARRERMTLGEALWPRLTVVSCWADAAAAGAVPALARALPHARVQPKGLLAVEGVVSIPLQRHDETIRVAAVAGHFLEFVDLDRPSARPLLAHELSPDAAYAPIISTGGGFYRYKLGDAVRCAGFHHQAPILRFEGRIDHVSDLCGEKLNPRLVASAIASAERDAGMSFTFALLAPTTGAPPHYCLYAEGPPAPAIAAAGVRVERALMESHGYRYARALGQLGPIRTVAVRDGAARYLRARAATGQRAGQIKPSHLDTSLDWAEVFGVATAEAGLSEVAS